MEGEREREREPSVGVRPGEMGLAHGHDSADVQLLRALSAENHSHTPHQHQQNGTGFARDPRALALEGLTAAEQQQQSNGHDVHGSGEYHSPQMPQAPPLTSLASRPPSSGPYPYEALRAEAER
jgi:hypothetical protein